jgi:tRNA (guanine-N7-)-methyltransferase
VGKDRSRRSIEAGVLATHAGAHPKKLFGRRKGWKLSPHQQSLMQTLLPRLTIAPRAGVDPREYFKSPAQDVWLEVGFGGGEHLLWQAEHNPSVGMIGCEPFVAGMAKLLSKISSDEVAQKEGVAKVETQSAPPPLPDPLPQRGRRNLLIYPGDAADVIAALPDASLGRVFVLFPDPWPKKRHHKRRFLQMEMLDQLARAIRAGAELRFASDDAGYVAWALERFMAHPHFLWTAQSPHDWRARTDDWPPTRYEQKALHGRPYYFRFLRV